MAVPLTDEVAIIEAGSEVVDPVAEKNVVTAVPNVDEVVVDPAAEENVVTAVPNVDEVLVLFPIGNIVIVEIDALRVLFAGEVFIAVSEDVVTVPEDMVELEVDIIGVPMLEIDTPLAAADNVSPRPMHLLMGVIKSLFS